MRRILITILISITSGSIGFAQNDTTEYLFKKANYCYVHYGGGYSPVFFSNGQRGHGFSANLIGVVFNNKISIGIDFDMWGKSYPYTISQYPFITSFTSMSLNLETLIRPRKTINFSIPFKIGSGSGQVTEIFPQNYYQVRNHRFVYIQPGAMVWVNLLKHLSLGCGAGYRFALGGYSTTYDLFSGFSGFAMLRFKFYTKEYMAKALERQRQYLEMQK